MLNIIVMLHIYIRNVTIFIIILFYQDSSLMQVQNANTKLWQAIFSVRIYNFGHLQNLRGLISFPFATILRVWRYTGINHGIFSKYTTSSAFQCPLCNLVTIPPCSWPQPSNKESNNLLYVMKYNENNPQIIALLSKQTLLCHQQKLFL